MTTHYLDEAEHCHRIAVMHAGKLVALGTTTELKRVFAERPILEIQAPNAVGRDASARRMPRHREDEPLRHRRARRARGDERLTPEALKAELEARGVDVTHAEQVEPSLEDVFLDVVERSGVMRKALAVGIKELRQIRRDRRTLMILLFIPVFFLLLYGYALNFDIKHVRLAVEDRDYTPESRRARLGVRELDLLRPGRFRDRRRRGERPHGSGRDPRRPDHPAGPRPRPRPRRSDVRRGAHQRGELDDGRDSPRLRADDHRQRIGAVRDALAGADAGRR